MPSRALSVFVLTMLLMATCALPSSAQSRRFGQPLKQSKEVGSTTTYFTADLDLQLDDATQQVISLRARENGFDYAPGEWTAARNDTGYYHLGDLNIRSRFSGGEWVDFSTAHGGTGAPLNQQSSETLAAFDLSGFFTGSGLRVVRYWENVDGVLGLRFELQNTSSRAVEIGGLGIPMVFNNIMHQRTLETAHAMNSFHDPYIGADAGYVQVARLDGLGPVLVVAAKGHTPLEAWRPLLDDRTPRGTTHEGFYEWMPHSVAYAENEWSQAQPWNVPTSAIVQPGATKSYGVQFLVAPDVRRIEDRLRQADVPVAVGLPGYVIPQNTDHQLFLASSSAVSQIEVEPLGSLIVEPSESPSPDWKAYSVRGKAWGRSRVSVHYEDGRVQTIQYKVIKTPSEVVRDMGEFLTTEQWFEEANDPFDRSPSVISYDYTNKRQVTEDSRAWIAGLGDEGGAGSWLTAAMKQHVEPDVNEIRKIERFVDETLWGGLQYSEGPWKYGVRKSLFYYAPDTMPKGTYSDSIAYGSWSSWSKEHAESVGRSYNYPHVAALYWTMYRLARNQVGLVQNHGWEWYLERAFETAEAMVRLAPDYAVFGQMEGTTFVRILEDLKREEWSDQAAKMEATMLARAEVWHNMAFPFGSEMPWDSTGQEEVYAWTRYFGFDEKAVVTLNAILAYMPTVPHWGYNGSARRYWDFWYGGHPNTSRLERQLHHYGSALNALPVLTEYRSHPEDAYLLRVGFAGMMGALANVTEDGFAPAAFHSFPSTLAIDGYSGDYGPGFLGFALNTASYLAQDETFGWVGYGGHVKEDGAVVTLYPWDAARSRAYVAPAGVWLELDSGVFKSISYNSDTKAIDVELEEASSFVPVARLHVSSPGSDVTYQADATLERGAYVLDLRSQQKLRLEPK
jgi:hypothetical protein